MSSGTMSLLGLYNWDNTILDGMSLPEGVDLEYMKKTLLRECAELEILYSDIDFLKEAISIWSLTELQTWERLYQAFTIEYNPIWNVDGTETEVEEHDLRFNATGNNTSTNQTAGYNSSNFQNSEKESLDTESDSYDRGTITRTKTRGGNIGVTMSQQLLEKELEVRPKLNIYRYITEDFKNRFCLLIY